MRDTAIASLTATIPAALLLAGLSRWNLWAGVAAIIVCLTAALLLRAR